MDRTEPIEKLEMRGVARHFGTTPALVDFDLQIAGGQFVTLLGPSGCGKSTALNCLAGLLPLTAGTIWLNDRPIVQIPAEKRGFGMVFQSYALFPHLTVARNVSYGLEIRRVPRAERTRRVAQALALVHLEGYADRYPGQLSGGQQQRLALARTVVLEPSLLLLDEPLSNLDAKLRNEMRIEIKRLHQLLKLTTVYVTHDQTEAMSLSDQVVVMRQGRIEQVGTPQEIYHRPRSLYVADFMGYANRLPVEIVDRTGGEWCVRTASGALLRATCTLEESGAWPAGRAVVACCRPDETLAGAPAGANRQAGQVQVVEYLGKGFESLVRLADAGDRPFLVQSTHPVPVGEFIDFGVPPDRLLLFPREAPAGAAATPALMAPREPALAGGR